MEEANYAIKAMLVIMCGIALVILLAFAVSVVSDLYKDTFKAKEMVRKNALYTKEAIYQRKIRIRLSLAAYAYEIKNCSIMSDEAFDVLSGEVDTSVITGNQKLDRFFAKHFDKSTGLWIHKHPELSRIADLYEYLYGDENNEHG